MDFLTLNLNLVFINFPICITIYCSINPRAAIFLGQLIPIEYYSFFPWGLIITCFHGYLILILSISQAVSCVLIYANLYYITIILSRELNLSLKPEQYRTTQNLRLFHNLQLEYRSFQILMEHWNELLSYIIWSGTLLFIGLPVLYIVIMLHSWSRLEFIAKFSLTTALVTCAASWITFLQCGKYLWLQGSKTLHSWKIQSWKNTRERLVMQKFHKSCRCVLMRYGRAIILERINQFSYVLSLIKWACKLTLSITK